MRRAAAAVLSALVAAGPAAAENIGVTAAPVLQLPIGARASALGSAYTGLSDDLSALHYNPAGLSSMASREASFMYLKGFEDQSLQHVAFGGPIPFAGVVGEGFTALAGSVLSASHGDIEINTLNANGTLASSESREAGSDLVMTLGYSERVAVFEVPMRQDSVRLEHQMGVSGKYIRSTLAEAYKASTFAGDAGYLVRAPDQGFGLGVAVLNIGSRLTFIEEGDPLPLTYRAGLSWSPQLPDTLTLPARQQVTMVGDVYHLVRERATRGLVGLEYSAMRSWAGRIGYRINDGSGGFTVGFGAGWGPLSLDYAWGMTSDISDTHRFSFTYRFGRVSTREREKKRKPFIESMPEKEELQGLEERKPDFIDQPQRPRREVPENRKSAPGWIY